MNVSKQAEPVVRAGHENDHHRARRRRLEVARGAVPASDGILLVDKPQGRIHQEDPVGGWDGSARDVGAAPTCTGGVLIATGPLHRLGLLGEAHRPSASRAGP